MLNCTVQLPLLLVFLPALLGYPEAHDVAKHKESLKKSAC
jgi:hypothetical protein